MTKTEKLEAAMRLLRANPELKVFSASRLTGANRNILMQCAKEANLPNVQPVVKEPKAPRAEPVKPKVQRRPPITREQLDQAEQLFREGYGITEVMREVRSHSPKISMMAQAMGVEMKIARYTAQQKADALALLREGHCYSYVFSKTDVSPVTLRRMAIKYGIHQPASRINVDGEQLDKLVAKHDGYGSIRSIAALYGVANSTVHNIEKRLGIVRKHKTAAFRDPELRQKIKDTRHLSLKEAAAVVKCPISTVRYHRSKKGEDHV